MITWGNLFIYLFFSVCVFSLSDGVSGLELPDLVTEPLTRMVRGMSRRRPPPTFNVSAFEKQLSPPSGAKLTAHIPTAPSIRDYTERSWVRFIAQKQFLGSD